jgi:hypothetical protein
MKVVAAAPSPTSTQQPTIDKTSIDHGIRAGRHLALNGGLN